MKAELALELTDLAVELYQTSEMSIVEAVEEITDIFEHFAIVVDEVDLECCCDECVDCF